VAALAGQRGARAQPSLSLQSSRCRPRSPRIRACYRQRSRGSADVAHRQAITDEIHRPALIGCEAWPARSACRTRAEVVKGHAIEPCRPGYKSVRHVCASAHATEAARVVHPCRKWKQPVANGRMHRSVTAIYMRVSTKVSTSRPAGQMRYDQPIVNVDRNGAIGLSRALAPHASALPGCATSRVWRAHAKQLEGELQSRTAKARKNC
jgi:hypothetical protein